MLYLACSSFSLPPPDRTPWASYWNSYSQSSSNFSEFRRRGIEDPYPLSGEIPLTRSSEFDYLRDSTLRKKAASLSGRNRGQNGRQVITGAKESRPCNRALVCYFWGLFCLWNIDGISHDTLYSATLLLLIQLQQYCLVGRNQPQLILEQQLPFCTEISPSMGFLSPLMCYYQEKMNNCEHHSFECY